MVDFRNKSRVVTGEPVIKVDADLPEGNYICQLTVVDKMGNKSKPARIRMKIHRRFIITGPVPIGRNTTRKPHI
jgi:hypothetical protein